MPDRPLPASYWVEPGRFLAGEYPGKPDPHLLHRRVIALLRAGFDTFIDLTNVGEREPYAPILLEEAPYYDLQVTHQRFSIGDHGLPSIEKMTTILEILEHALASGRKVYLHCWAGVGRTGTTVGCYLVGHGMNGEQALAHLAKIFSTAEQSQWYPQSPETAAQINFVLHWAQAKSPSS